MEQTLTGKIRFRLGWGGVLVLQVQYRSGNVTRGTFDEVVLWRDATIKDVTDSSCIILDKVFHVVAL